MGYTKANQQAHRTANGMSKTQCKTLNTMLNRDGEIVGQSRSSDLAIVPRGDRRCRPIGWVGTEDLQVLLAMGVVVQDGDKYMLSASYRRRALARSADKSKGQKTNPANLVDNVRTFSAQHRDGFKCQVYHPDGIARQTQKVRGASGMDRILRMKDKAGLSYFDTHELEAAARFVSDYGRANMAALATQTYGGVHGGTKRNTAEDLSISALDARKRVMDSLAFVGVGLAQSLDVLRDSDMSMGAVEYSQNWSRGSGKTVLKLALARLSEYYGTQVGISAKR